MSAMLRQIEWGVRNGPITKNEVLPVTTFLFENFASVQDLLIMSLFDVPITQMSHIHTFLKHWSFI